MKKFYLVAILLVLFISFTSADLIMPGYRYVEINNVISNFEDFSNYTFLVVCHRPMIRMELLNEKVISTSCYKFSQMSIYATKKEGFNISNMPCFDSDSCTSEKGAELESYLNNSDKFIEVLKNVPHTLYVPISDTRGSINNYYEISINDSTNSLKEVVVKRNALFYFYILAPMVAVLAIIFIIYKRKKNVAN